MPTGTVTFLFTDIEGSTRLWDQRTEEMGRALQRHDEILAGAIDRHGGFVFTTAGDSFSAAFATANEAIAAAVEAQRALQVEPWPDAVPIRVRMGLHTGIAEVRDSDYFGPDVIRAARVEAAGHGGQILVSEATAALVRDGQLRSVGRHRLSGFGDDVELFQLGDGEFPPVRTTSRRRDNLPPADTALLGRDEAIGEVLGLLDRHRVVTVTGPGGIGKTSLANAVGHRLAERPEADVWWCDLVSVGADDVASSIGRSVGLTSGVREARAVAAVMAERGETWLIIDNCEQVVDTVAEVVDDLLAGCSVRVVTTSRVPLDVGDEAVMALPPLDASTTGAELFVREAERVGGLAAGDPDEATVRAICARLDGIPLAIELVAARTRSLSLSDIDARLVALLQSGKARRGDRHATMSAAIEWSVQLLDEELPPGLGALAVFPGSFALPAAEAVLGPEIPGDPLDAIDTFVAHSLLDARPDDRGQVRYRLLEPIKQYVAATLWHDPAATRHRHLEYFLDKLEAAYDTLGTSSCVPYLDVIDHDIADLAAAHDWALESGRIADDLRIYRPISFAWLHGSWENFDWARETADVPGVETHDDWGSCWSAAFMRMIVFEHPEPDVFAAFLARGEAISPDAVGQDRANLVIAAFLGLFGHVDWDGALTRLERSTPGDTSTTFLQYYWGAMTTWRAALASGDRPIDEAMAEAIEIHDRGLGWAASIGARNLEAGLLQNLGRLLNLAGEHEAAEKLSREAELMAAPMGMTTVADFANLNVLGAAMNGVEIPDDPGRRLERLLESCVENDPGVVLPYALRTAARILTAIGDAETAVLCLLQPVEDEDALPPLGRADFADEVWDRAERESETLTTLDVARRALDSVRRHRGAAAASSSQTA